MILMMILMFLPLLAIPVFWFLPLGDAIGIYIVCLLLSASMHWIMHTSMKRPAATGRESLVGEEVKVITKSSTDKISPYQVRIEGELWSADSPDSLEKGETVVITAYQGNRLKVERKTETKGEE